MQSVGCNFGAGGRPSVVALYCYNHLTSRLQDFEVEMQNASLELVTYVGRYLRGQHAEPK